MKDKHTSIIVDSHFTYTYLESADMSSQKGSTYICLNLSKRNK